jgi:hypothetical protein
VGLVTLSDRVGACSTFDRGASRVRLQRLVLSAYAIAWELATNRNPKLRDGTIAVLWAKRACELTEWRNPAYLDTLAAAHAESRDFEAAVKCQSKAIELRDDEKEKKDLRTRLKLYQAKRPYHTASP